MTDDFLAAHDPQSALAAAANIRQAVETLSNHPLIGRIVAGDLRELVISFGKTGYIAFCTRGIKFAPWPYCTSGSWTIRFNRLPMNREQIYFRRSKRSDSEDCRFEHTQIGAYHSQYGNKEATDQTSTDPAIGIADALFTKVQRMRAVQKSRPA